jgi:hypothetical protein
MAIQVPGTGTNTGTPVFDTPGTPFTSAAGFSAAIAAALAGALAVLQGLNVLEISEPVRIALIGLVGVGILAWAIAAAGDSLARAYGLAHVTRKVGEENQPAIQTAANKLAEVYAAANGITITDGKLTPAPQGQVTPLPTPLKVKLRGKDALAIALLVSGESGKETQRYLVGLPDAQLTWVSSDAISLPATPTPATPAPVAPTPATPASAATPAPGGNASPPDNGSTTN